uniref:(northern house mosquito) hypothetical protein n=1 Tax=Culex pipiens TaxID=7175 RepID=A0A8D8NI11_CULPI
MSEHSGPERGFVPVGSAEQRARTVGHFRFRIVNRQSRFFQQQQFVDRFFLFLLLQQSKLIEQQHKYKHSVLVVFVVDGHFRVRVFLGGRRNFGLVLLFTTVVSILECHHHFGRRSAVRGQAKLELTVRSAEKVPAGRTRFRQLASRFEQFRGILGRWFVQ